MAEGPDVGVGGMISPPFAQPLIGDVEHVIGDEVGKHHSDCTATATITEGESHYEACLARESVPGNPDLGIMIPLLNRAFDASEVRS